MKAVWLTAKQIAATMGIDKRSFNRLANDNQWPCQTETGRGGTHKVYKLAALPTEVQTAYAVSHGIDLSAVQEPSKPASKTDKKVVIEGYNGRGAKTKKVKPLEEIPDRYLQVGALRVQVVNTYSVSGLSVKDFVEAYNGGSLCNDIRAELGRWGKINTANTFYYEWLAAYEQFGMAGLCPQYGKRGGSGASLDDRARELIRGLYLDPRKPGVASVVRDITQFGYALSDSIVRRYIKDEIPKAAIILGREGATAFHNKCETYIERDYTLLKSMEMVCGDHHNFDFVVNYNGKVLRPWLTMFIDMRSRKILGWWIDLVPNTLTIMRAFSMLVDAGGLPANALLDNGKDFKSEWFAGSAWKNQKTRIEKGPLYVIDGVLQDCGCKAHFATPYRGQSKPIERAFRTIIELFCKKSPFYTGSNTVDAPEDKQLYWRKINGRERIEVTYTLEQLRLDFENFVKWFNSCWHHSGQGMNGATPDEVFAANLEQRRELPADKRKWIFAIRERRVVQRDGVSVNGIWYSCEKMISVLGQTVEVRRDINDIGKVAIFSLPDVLYLFDAESDLFKDKGLGEEQIRGARTLLKKQKAIIREFTVGAKEIQAAAKTPADLLAESLAKREFPSILETREDKVLLVANGAPEVAVQPRRRLRLPTDPD